MAPILIQSLAEHSMVNLRAMMFMANDLLATAAETGQRQLDENLFFDVYRGIAKKKGVENNYSGDKYFANYYAQTTAK